LGIPAMVVGTGLQTDPLAPGELLLIDWASVAGHADLITVDSSDETSLEMSDSPTSDTTAPTMVNTVSMFQTHAVATKVVAWFAIARLRDNCVAKLTNVQWGGSPLTF